jgi:hypothetical protein
MFLVSYLKFVFDTVWWRVKQVVRSVVKILQCVGHTR